MDGMDAVLVIFDVTHITENDLHIAEGMKEKKVPVVLALNKIDLANPEQILAATAKTAEAGFDEIIPVSAKNGDGISELVDDKMIISISAEGPEDHIYSIKRDLNQALQSMAERELLQYAQSNITINLEGAKGQNTDRSDPGHFNGKGPEDSGPMQDAQGGDAAQGTEDGESVHEGEEDTSSVRERLKQVRERDKRRGVIRGTKVDDPDGET